MLPPPYPAYPNPFNVNNRIDDGRNGRNGKRRDGEEKDERKQDDEPKSITIPPTYSAFIPGNYGILAIKTVFGLSSCRFLSF